MKFTKRTIAGAVAGSLLAGGAAFAAMTLTGAGTAKADAYQGKNLTISQESFDKPVWPGVEAAFTFAVTNENPFPVEIQQISFDESRKNLVELTCGGKDAAEKLANVKKLSGPAGTVGTVYNLKDSEKKTVPANGWVNVTIPAALKLDASATAGCSVVVPFKVTGAGSGK
jgi:hypothetical protein